MPLLEMCPQPLRRLIACLLFLWFRPAHAHHGRDFILVQDSAIPSSLGGVALTSVEYTQEGSLNEFSTEPGFFIGLAPALAFGLNIGFSDEGDGWRYKGITPQWVLTLPVPQGPLNFRAGLWTAYEFTEVAGHAHGQSAVHLHDPGTGPDAPPPIIHDHGSGGHGHSKHSGIHRHGESGWHNRLILETDIERHTRLVVNLVSFVSGDGGAPGWGYAAGFRHELNHDFSLGVEATGDFEETSSSQQVLLTGMLGLPSGLVLRIGIGAGLTPSAPDLTLHSGLLWRF